MTSEADIEIGDVTAIVLAGGRGVRLGGTGFGDKATTMIGNRTMLDVVLSTIPTAVGIVVVGPPVAIGRPVVWTQEHPPGGGPVAAVAAGLESVNSPLVAIIPGDSPRAGLAIEALAAALAAAGDDVDAAVVTETMSARPNPLLAVWRRAALTDSIESLAATGGCRDRAAFDLYRSVALVEVPDSGRWGDDVDDLADLDREVRGLAERSHPDARMDP